MSYASEKDVPEKDLLRALLGVCCWKLSCDVMWRRSRGCVMAFWLVFLGAFQAQKILPVNLSFSLVVWLIRGVWYFDKQLLGLCVVWCCLAWCGVLCDR